MTRRVEGPGSDGGDAGHEGVEEPGGTGGADASLSAGCLRVGPDGLDLSRPWQQVPWVVIDVEGNGQRPPDLIEAACLPIDSGIPGPVRTWLIRPPRPITGPVRRIHGIRNADVAAAPPIADVAEQIREQLAGRLVIGHHVHVDLAVLGRELGGWTAPAALDTLRLAKAVWPGLPSYSLDNLTSADHVLPPSAFPASGVSPLPTTALGGRHRAGYDATLTAALFLALTRTVTGTNGAAGPRQATAGGGPSAARLLALAGARPPDVQDDSGRLF